MNIFTYIAVPVYPYADPFSHQLLNDWQHGLWFIFPISIYFSTVFSGSMKSKDKYLI